MADLATPQFLEQLKSIYPKSSSLQGTKAVLANPWYFLTAVGFGSSNRPEAVPLVFLNALEDLKKAQKAEGVDEATAQAEQLLLARRFREGILKGGILCGASRAINSLIALHEVMPPELRDKQTLRDQSVTTEQYVANGEKLFRSMYRETADKVQGLLDEIYPDMGWFSKVIGYGMTYNETDVLSQVEVSYILVAALIAVDTPRQIAWHLANAQHGGASLDEAKAVRQISIEVAQKSGIKWRDAVPEATPI
ncbi:hypothetical protein NM688_g7853 [Phlebia brevispora]|uniref:Uncharacterized protein n=1 Tax=Phlebia brevispora TaxID=194682 RepID=A0ACC1S0E3_9APHY|nr:hypothetical protein NM688_g7853 [Phlebia brevispora]